MRVKVKENLPETFFGFYQDKRRRPGDEFTLVDVYEMAGDPPKPVLKNGKKVLKAKAKSFFSEKWMEEISTPSVKKEIEEDFSL